MITKDELEAQYNLFKETERQLEDMQNDPFVQLYLKAKEQCETLQKEIGDWAESIGKMVDEETWTKDTFSKGKKEIAIDGKLRIYRSSKTTRVIRTKDFVTAYPFLANEMIEKGIIRIPVKATEDEIGKKELDTICDKTKTYKYELVFWKEEPHDQLRIYTKPEGEGQPVANT